MENRRTILFSGSGTNGDLYPLIGIALEISKRGFPVVFLVNDFYRSLVNDHGFGFLSTGTKQQHIEFHGDARTWDPASDVIEIGFDGFIRQTIEASYRHVIGQHKKTRSLAVIGTYPLLNGATMAADSLTIPHTTVTLSPRYIPSHVAPPAPLKWVLPNWFPPTLKRSIFKTISYASARRLMRKAYFQRLNEMRKSFGLDPISTSQMVGTFSEPHLHIATFPDWYGMRAPDWPPDVHTVGFPLFSHGEHGACKAVDDFIDSQGSPLVFTSGTGVKDSGPLFNEAKKICDSLALPGLFVGSVDSWVECPEDRFLHVDYIDFRYVLPRCRVIVHHGGIGTLAEAVRAGVPQLIRPLAFDQFDNADRAHRLGLGSFILPKHFEAKRVTPVIRALLAYRQASDIIDVFSTEVNDNQAIPKACDLIEDYLSH